MLHVNSNSWVLAWYIKTLNHVHGFTKIDVLVQSKGKSTLYLPLKNCSHKYYIFAFGFFM
jgi:hypothetical protein